MDWPLLLKLASIPWWLPLAAVLAMRRIGAERVGLTMHPTLQTLVNARKLETVMDVPLSGNGAPYRDGG